MIATVPASSSGSPSRECAAHPLDNVVWHALTTCHAGLDTGNARARRYEAACEPFVALPDPSQPDPRALDLVTSVGDEVGLLTPEAFAYPDNFDCMLQGDVAQMIAPRFGAARIDCDFVELGQADAWEMIQFVRMSDKVRFGSRTPEMGRHVGVRIDGRLIAMAGERMHLTGYREIGGVHVDPACRGRGLASGLVQVVSEGIRQRGETPFLHVYVKNRPAMALYRKMGFEVRRVMKFVVLQRLA